MKINEKLVCMTKQMWEGYDSKTFPLKVINCVDIIVNTI